MQAINVSRSPGSSFIKKIEIQVCPQNFLDLFNQTFFDQATAFSLSGEMIKIKGSFQFS
jgi:hypothetical protein